MSRESLDKIISEGAKNEKKRWSVDGKPWQLFRHDAQLYLYDPDPEVRDRRYEDEYPGITDELRSFLYNIPDALVWDVCGIADATSLGAKETLCLLLATPDDHSLDTPTRSVLASDITRVDGLRPLFEASKGRRPSAIFFNPGGAFSGRELAQFRTRIGRALLLHLRAGFGELSDGGYLFIQYPFRYFKMRPADVEVFFDAVHSLLGDRAEYRHTRGSKFMIVRKKTHGAVV